MKCSLTLQACNEKIWLLANSVLAVLFTCLGLAGVVAVLGLTTIGATIAIKYVNQLILG